MKGSEQDDARQHDITRAPKQQRLPEGDQTESSTHEWPLQRDAAEEDEREEREELNGHIPGEPERGHGGPSCVGYAPTIRLLAREFNPGAVF